jgi:hypothetical protein
METLNQDDIFWIMKFAISRNFDVSSSVHDLIVNTYWYTHNFEQDEFSSILADSKYSESQREQIRTQIVLCYTLFESLDGKRENLVVYTLDAAQKVTRWWSYYLDEATKDCGNYDDFEATLPELLRLGFICIPHGDSLQ